MNEPQGDDPIAAAERKGFRRGLCVGLIAFSVLCTLGSALRSWMEVPRFEAVFRQVKVQMPALTEMVFNSWGYVVVGLIAGACVCAVLTLRGGAQRRTVVLSVALFAFSLLWLGLTSLAVQAPFWSLMEEIGRPRR